MCLASITSILIRRHLGPTFLSNRVAHTLTQLVPIVGPTHQTASPARATPSVGTDSEHTTCCPHNEQLYVKCRRPSPGDQ